MVFILPSFSAAANYRLSPVVGGIAGQVPGFKDVKSDLFAKALRDANQIEYAAAVGMADNALKQKSAIVRRGMIDDALMDRLEFAEEARKKRDKTNMLLAMAGLNSGGKQQSVRSGRQQRMAGSGLLGPLETLVKFHQMEDALDTSMYRQLGPLNAMDAKGQELFGTVPAPSNSQISLPEIPQAGIEVEPAPTVGNTFSEKAKFEAGLLKKLMDSGQLSLAKK